MPRITGGCLCGAVRYSIDGEPIPTASFSAIVWTARNTPARLSFRASRSRQIVL